MARLHRFLICLAVSTVVVVGTAVAEVSVGGQVVGPGGRGLAGIRVGLEPILPDYERVATRLGGEVGPGPAAEAATDADGYFELSAPERGAWKVVVAWGSDGEVTGVPPSYVTEEYVLRPLTEPTELPPVELQPASVVEIEVVDENGTPADARLGLSDTRRSRDGWRSRLRLARTGGDGLVRLALGAEEEPRLEVLGPSHPIATMAGDELRAKGGSIGLRLPPGGFAGTAVVTDRGGRAVAGAVAYQGRGIVPLGRTDEEGRLRLVAAPPEQAPDTVRFVTHDRLMGHFEPRFSPDEAIEAEVVLEPLPRIRGRVIDLESRDPVAGALVWIPYRQVTRSDSRGFYELRPFPAPLVMLQAVAEGYAMARERKQLRDAEAGDGPTIALAPAASVRGSVVDGEGRPLAGVDVSLRPVGDASPFRAAAFHRGDFSTRSTRRGWFFLSGLAPAASYELRFRKSGFAPHRLSLEGLEAFEKRSGLEVVLDSGHSGEGWVVDEADVPVAGAEVRLVPVVFGDPRAAAYRRMFSDREGDEVSSSTDSEGRFRLSHLAAGRYNLEVRAAGFAPFTVPGLAVGAEPGEKDFGTVVLERGMRLGGSVLDREGSPIAEAEVRVRRPDTPFGFQAPSEPSARSDGSGRFEVADLEAGKQYVVVVSKSGFSSEAANVVAEEGGTVEFVLRRSGTISGRVGNEDRDPVEGATVFVEAMSMTRRFDVSHPRPARTDGEGAFRLEGVDTGTVHLSVQAQGYQRYQLRDLEVPSGGEVSDVDVVLLRGATIVGTVTRRDGTPVVGVRVSWSPARESMSGPSYGTGGETDGEGRYRLDGVAPGPAMIQAAHGNHRQVSKSVEVASGTQTVDLAFDDGFEISGRVSDSSGKSVPGASLTLTSTDTAQTRFSMQPGNPATSGADGTFTLTDVAPGLYLLAASKEGYAQAATPEPFEVSNGPVAGIELELKRGATLRGRILGLETDELAAVVIHAYGGSAGGGMQMGIVDFEGRYSVGNLGPGQWHLTARLDAAGRQASGLLTVEEGQTEASLDLEFKTGFQLEGVVKSAGQPQAGVNIVASGYDMGLGHAQAVSESDGRFRFAHLPAGKYRLIVVNAVSQHFQEVEVPADREVVVELGARQITGHVRDETGERVVPGAMVRIERLDADTADLLFALSGRSQTATDSRGYFRLSANEGVYRVIATKAGFGPSETTVEVGVGSRNEDIELRMLPTDGISFDLLTESSAVPSEVMTAVLDPSGQVMTQGRVPVGEGGRVRLSTVPPGSWELAVQADDSAVVLTPITAPGHVGQVRLPLGGALKIKVPALVGEQPSFNPTQVARVQLTGPHGRPHYLLERMIGAARQWPVWNGEATIPRLMPGAWKFTIDHPDGRSWSGDAMVAAGQTSEVVVP